MSTQGIHRISTQARFRGPFALLYLVVLLGFCCAATANTTADQGNISPASTGGIETADVVVDGRVILTVRGVSAYPAKKRVAEIYNQIIAVAQDEDIPAGAVVVKEMGDRTQLMAGNRLLLDLFDLDGEMEGVSRQILAEAKQLVLQQTLVNYRLDRTPRVLLSNALYVLAATLVAVGLIFGFRRGFDALNRILERRLKDQLKALERQSARFVKAQQLARFLRALIKTLYAALLVFILYFYLNFALGQFPWTRGFAVWLFDLILAPLRSMGEALIVAVPDLIFLVILYYVSRYVLRMIKAFFEGIDQGAIRPRSFEREWAWPTYRILRLVVIIFALVVAYPYIPGSESEAFKGISILLGLIVSLGCIGTYWTCSTSTEWRS